MVCSARGHGGWHCSTLKLLERMQMTPKLAWSQIMGRACCNPNLWHVLCTLHCIHCLYLVFPCSALLCVTTCFCLDNRDAPGVTIQCLTRAGLVIFWLFFMLDDWNVLLRDEKYPKNVSHFHLSLWSQRQNVTWGQQSFYSILFYCIVLSHRVHSDDPSKSCLQQFEQ